MFSLVTACMNREQHLRQTLPRWLELPDLAEIVIVDWSTRESLADLLDLDPRVRICRVEGETRWVLPYSVNFGVSQATHDHIVKCDADCVPSRRIARYVPTTRTFYAGNELQGRTLGKPSVGGQCVFSRAQFERVNGYSELFRFYGRAHEDFYSRLSATGLVRRNIGACNLDFIEHPDEARVANQAAPAAANPVEAFLHRQTPFHEMTNRVIGQCKPWGPWFPRAVFHPLRREGRFATFRRDTSREIPLPAGVLQQAQAYGLAAVVAQLYSLSPAEAAHLDRNRALELLRSYLDRQPSPLPGKTPARDLLDAFSDS